MRSDLVFIAVKQVSNRFLLVKALAKATRGFHKSGARFEDTTNDVLRHFGRPKSIAQRSAVPIAAGVPTHRGRPLAAITNRSNRLNVPAVLESPHSLTGVLQLTGNWVEV
jgi:hypothetical protein